MKLSIAQSGRHFVGENNEPFFWLADTAWNAPLRDDTPAWERYLSTRKAQGFTVIQFVATPWRGSKEPVHGPLFRESASGVAFDDHAWEKMEEWIALIIKHGMVPSPVIIWDNNPDEAFFKFRNETCIAVGRRMLERWGKFNPVWILAGDGDYRWAGQIEKWKAVGRAVFEGYPDALATMHPCGCSWVGDIFADEPWYSFVGIQSGHGSAPYDLRFLLDGPYAHRWQSIRKPFVNMELNYEFARSYNNQNLQYDAYHVRRAVWWSLLGAPVAGVTYGNNPIWIWPLERYEFAEGHGQWGSGRWTTGLETEGIDHLGVARDIMHDLPWQDLLPANQLLFDQPGWGDNPEDYCKAGATADLATVVVYRPSGGAIKLMGDSALKGYRATWANPRNGQTQECTLKTDNGLCTTETPTGHDWVLILKKDQ